MCRLGSQLRMLARSSPFPIAPLVGFVAALLTLSFEELLARFQIDDAVGAAPWESNRQQEIPSGLSDIRSSGGAPRLPALSQIFFQVAAHGPSGAWGTLAVALFANKHCGDNHDYSGIFFGGGDAAWRLLGVQAGQTTDNPSRLLL